jgi:oligosaccharide translocation protein RFT1
MGGGYMFSYFYKPLLSLGGSFFMQSIFKYVLTQGDTLLISSLASQRAQGIYALAANYGGLVARLILQPIEESSRNYFGKLLSFPPGPRSSKENILEARTSFHTFLRSYENTPEARKSLHTLLRSYILLSVCLVAVGPTVAPLLLKIIAGSKWTSSGAGHVLAIYCYYIPLLAINGLTEAFVSSVATEEEVNRQSIWMLAFSAGFGGAAFIFLRVLDMGAEGLVWANTLNMVFRIIWSSAFISSYLKMRGSQLDIRTLIPRPMTIAVRIT